LHHTHDAKEKERKRKMSPYDSKKKLKTPTRSPNNGTYGEPGDDDDGEPKCPHRQKEGARFPA
jgi:hypothetical protein